MPAGLCMVPCPPDSDFEIIYILNVNKNTFQLEICLNLCTNEFLDDDLSAHEARNYCMSSFNILNEHETFGVVTAAEWRSLQLVFLSAQRELPSLPVCGSLRHSKVA